MSELSEQPTSAATGSVEPQVPSVEQEPTPIADATGTPSHQGSGEISSDANTNESIDVAGTFNAESPATTLSSLSPLKAPGANAEQATTTTREELNPTTSEQLISTESLQKLWHPQLQAWASQGELLKAASKALHLDNTHPPEQLDTLIARLAEGETSDIPPIELLEQITMHGAAGAYATSKQTIYLNEDWVQTATQADAIKVLTEEYGHHLDALLNNIDTPGDEGQHFAELLVKAKPAGDNAHNKQPNDHGLIELDGEVIDVEFARTNATTQTLFNKGLQLQGAASNTTYLRHHNNGLQSSHAPWSRKTGYSIKSSVSSGKTAKIGQPWASSIVFKPETPKHDGNQYIWQAGRIAGGADAIFLYLDSNRNLNFRVGDWGNYLKFESTNALSIDEWTGLYIDYNGGRTNDEDVNKGRYRIKQVSLSDGSSQNITGSWTSSGDGSTAIIGPEFYLGASQAGGAGLHGEIASLVFTTLKYNTNLPNNTEIGNMTTDPNEWVYDQKATNKYREPQKHNQLTGQINGGTVGFRPLDMAFEFRAPYTHTISSARSTRVYLFGDDSSLGGKETNLSNGINNRIYPGMNSLDLVRIRSNNQTHLTNVIVPGISPTITNVSSSNANGTYTVGDKITIQLTFSRSVVVTGTPQLLLETGANDRVASYQGGSGTSTLLFDYTIQNGDTSSDLSYSSASALSLNGGTIHAGYAANNAYLVLSNPGDPTSLSNNKAIVISTPTTGPSINNSQSFNYNENRTAGRIGVTVASTAGDGGNASNFRFADNASQTSPDGFFSIDNTGRISITNAGIAAGVAQNDFESGANSFNYNIQAFDGFNWGNANAITLNLLNVAETGPSINTSQSFNYNENRTAGRIGVTVASTAGDGGNASNFRFADNASQTSPDGFFSIDNTGRISITNAGIAAGVAQNDFESGANSFNYNIQAFDGSNWGNANAITLNLLNVAETGPSINTSQSFNYNENRTAGRIGVTVASTAGDGGNASNFRFADNASQTSPDGFFSIDNTGRISITNAGIAAGVAQNDFESGANSFNYNIQAFDGFNWGNANAIRLNVLDLKESSAINGTSAVRNTPKSNSNSKEDASKDTDQDGILDSIEAQVELQEPGPIDKNKDGIADFMQNSVATYQLNNGRLGSIALRNANLLPQQRTSNGLIRANSHLYFLGINDKETISAGTLEAKAQELVKRGFVQNATKILATSDQPIFRISPETISEGAVNEIENNAYQSKVNKSFEATTHRIDYYLEEEINDWHALVHADALTNLEILGYDPITGLGSIMADRNGNGKIDGATFFLKDNQAGDNNPAPLVIDTTIGAAQLANTPELIATSDGQGLTVKGPEGLGLWLKLKHNNSDPTSKSSIQLISNRRNAIGSINANHKQTPETTEIYLQVGEELRFQHIDDSIDTEIKTLTSLQAEPNQSWNVKLNTEALPEKRSDRQEIVIKSGLTPTNLEDCMLARSQTHSHAGVIDLRTIGKDNITLNIEIRHNSDNQNQLAFVRLDDQNQTLNINGLTTDQSTEFQGAAHSAIIHPNTQPINLEGRHSTQFQWTLESHEFGLYAPALIRSDGNLITASNPPSGVQPGGLKLLGMNYFGFEDTLHNSRNDWNYDDLTIHVSVV